jgi:photosystem II stability/assembly factor-like uncharacterized protein
LKLLLVLIAQLAFTGLACAEAPRSVAVEQPVVEKQSVASLEEVGGRVLFMHTDAVSPQKLWAGTTHGGLWHSVDNGQSWTLASGLMKNMAVGAVAADPLNTETIYAGTGEGRSNRADLHGHGMFKSIDGGASWSLLPLTDPATVGENWSHINAIAISTTGVMLAATSDNRYNGFIYRSIDGGQSWGLVPVYVGSKVGPRNIIYKVRFDPDNPNTALFMDAYANVTYSSDGGASWSVSRKGKTCP